jgi:DNA-binding GntR family transcriptional regulator
VASVDLHESSSLANHAADLVREMILTGELAPGARIIENRLAPVLGLSRPPLREGLRKLEQEGLVVQEMYRGVTVVVLGRQDVYEIVTLRRLLEETAVRIGVPAREAARLDLLEAALDTMEANARENNERSAANDSYAFHLAIVGLAGNSRLLSSYRSLNLQLTMALNRRARADGETLLERAARHRAVWERVLDGDVGGTLALLHDTASLDFARRMPHEGIVTVEAAEWFDALYATGDNGDSPTEGPA